MSEKPSGYDRIPGDRYYTPLWVTELLIKAEEMRPPIWDPAAGAGHILAAFHEAGWPMNQLRGTDIAPDVEPVRVLSTPDRPSPSLTVTPGDFFQMSGGDGTVISNPPFGPQGRTAVRFIRHALSEAEHWDGKVAMLLPMSFDSASGRRDLFKDHPAFVGKYTLTKRIIWANLPPKFDKNGRQIGSTKDHAWFIWDWRRHPLNGNRFLRYLP
jgi:hypothetical protein